MTCKSEKKSYPHARDGRISVTALAFMAGLDLASFLFAPGVFIAQARSRRDRAWPDRRVRRGGDGARGAAGASKPRPADVRRGGECGLAIHGFAAERMA